MSDRPTRLERARALFAERAWQDAYALLIDADRDEPLAPDDLERLSRCAALTARDDEFLRTTERLYQHGVDVGEWRRAARCGFWLGLRLFALGEPGLAAGWLGRAQRAVDRVGGACVEAGYLLLPAAQRSLLSGDMAAADATVREAIAIGEQFEEPDLISFGRCLQGRILLAQNQFEAGIALLDEAMVGVSSGECSPLISGLIYCTVIACCQKAYAFDRAREWTHALTRWCHDQPQLEEFAGTCLVHRAEILELGGQWAEAIEEAQRAFDRLAPSDRTSLANAHYCQAEVHRQRGELEEAEAGYREASRCGGLPQPGLALLRKAQGRTDDAVSGIRAALETTTSPWQRARYLPAAVDILLGAGRLDDAREACAELERCASDFDNEILGAMAAHARGAVAVAENDAQAAVEPLRHALQAWLEIDAPYIAARIRVLLATAYRSLGDEDGAKLELDAARAVFAELGASGDLERLAGGDRGATAAAATGLSPRELEVLGLIAEGKTNKEIATALELSARTIDRHVSNIFLKIDVSTRAAATAFAYEHKLL